MRTALGAVAWTVIIVGAFGCGTREESAQAAANQPRSSLDPLVAAEASSAGLPQQYRAVCYETTAHNNRPYILTKWLDNRAKAEEYGNYHGNHKAKFHHWKIEQREKPK